ncbi:MAG TPA: response regulator [Burkholderiaceae bacterium]|nr:response regulator [Burkholderiaceae bacterium]
MAAAESTWWVELIKASPGLVTAGLVIGIVVAYRKEMRTLLSNMTKFKGLGIEAEFGGKQMNEAIAAHKVPVSDGDRKGALRRLQFVAPLLRDLRVLWVDDDPAGNRHERALLEDFGVRVTTATTSAEAEQALTQSEFHLVVTDLNREGKPTEGLEFVARTLQAGIYRWTVAYVGTDQRNKAMPAGLFGITNRPDHLMHLVCDVAERERL